MKKFIFLLIFIIMLMPIAFSDDIDNFSDTFDGIPDVETLLDGQKTITNKEFEDIVNALEAKQKQKEAKKRKKMIKKISGGGDSLHKDLNIEKDVPSMELLKPEKEDLIINVPVNLRLADAYLESGYYKILANKDEEGQYYLKFYQSSFYKGKFPAAITEDDFGEKELDFARIIHYDDHFVKLIFGSLDVNAYAYIPCERNSAD